ncbi:MAG: TonB-dependent receptor domain-containing protein [Caulobacteraceae bacterium]
MAGAAALIPATGALAQHVIYQTAPAGSQPARAKPPSSDTTVAPLVVTGKRPDVITSIDRKSYSVASDLQATTGSIADALRNVPSVEVDLEGNVSLRGDSNVTILLDGKPSAMFSGDGKGDALQNLSADQVDRIEVMTNPSAAFRPDGSGGIINLVTRKTRKPGTSGSVRANAGNDGKYNAGASGVQRAGKWTFSGDAGFRHEAVKGSTDTERAVLDPVSGDFLEQRLSAVSNGEGDMRNARASIDYDPDASTRLSASLTHRTVAFTSDVVETFEAGDAAGAPAAAFTLNGSNTFDIKNTEGRIGLLKRFSGEGHELTADLTRERSEFDRGSHNFIDASLPVQAVTYTTFSNATTNNRSELQIDYTRPFKGGAQLKTGFDIERTELTYDNFGVSGPTPGGLAPDPALTNLFLYDQTLAAAYVTYQRPFGKLTMQLGLRAEQAYIDTDQVTSNQQNQNDYGALYPTAHLSYDLSETQQLTASYSKRVQRPNPQDLNPYLVYVDPQNYQSGNPNLDPEETNSFEIGWQRRGGGGFLQATVYYRDTTGSITSVVEDIGGGVLLTTRDNLGSRRAAGLELVANGKLTKSLSYNVSGNFYWNEIDAANLGFAGTRSGTSASGRASLNWQPTSKDFFQINGFMMGDQLLPQGERKATGMLNLGYRRKIDDQLSLVVTAQNVLDSFEFTTVIDTPDLRDTTTRRMHAGAAFFLGVTYSFGGQGGKRDREPQFDFGGGDVPG